MKPARILILEDDLGWVATVTSVLSPVSATLVGVQDLSAALDAVATQYFNVAIVDISLSHGDPKDSQGMRFLQALREQQLEGVVLPIVLSAYGDMERAVAAFRDFHVQDFLLKAPFEPQKLVDAVTRALGSNHLNRDLEIETTSNQPIHSLWQRFDWARRESQVELTAEMADLLKRLFPGAHHLFIRPLQAGQSGAGVLQVTPTYGYTVGLPVVVKFGKKAKILQEQTNYDEFIERYISDQSSTQLDHTVGRAMGAIRYRLIGAELGEVASFGEFYHNAEVGDIQQALDNLFDHTCRRWYDNREQPRRNRNLTKLYYDGLHMEWEEVWDGMEQTDVDIRAESLSFPGLSQRFANPRLWLEQRNYEVFLPAWRAITHGDLNEYNVLVTDDWRCWLVDFYRTGWGHILRDFVEMETAVKFGLFTPTNLAEHHRLEALLHDQTVKGRSEVTDPNDPLYKPLVVIGYLRELVSTYTDSDPEMVEYHVALLLQTLNVLRLPFFQASHLRAALSSAMLCEWLTDADL